MPVRYRRNTVCIDVGGGGGIVCKKVPILTNDIGHHNGTCHGALIEQRVHLWAGTCVSACVCAQGLVCVTNHNQLARGAGGCSSLHETKRKGRSEPSNSRTHKAVIDIHCWLSKSEVDITSFQAARESAIMMDS